MKDLLRPILNLLAPSIDVLLYFPTLMACFGLKGVRALGISRLPVVRSAFLTAGIYPIKDHYYEPLFNPNRLRFSMREDRSLPGIQWHLEEQKEFCDQLNFQSEIWAIQESPVRKLQYDFANDTFRAGDSEFLYCMIRNKKPKKLIEIGSGNSTLMAVQAIQQNKLEDPTYSCEHICIEPFERPWLAQLDIKLVRELVENLDKSIFKSLQANDILFIDSSHIIRPQGDVICAYLETLPILNAGVLVHVHDIFSPKDYLTNWLEQDMKLWNEQYLLEAFLSHNQDFKIIGSLNFLKYHAPESLASCCPVFGKDPDLYEPGSFWFQKIR